MEKTNLEKLMELKQLYEAGILTKEEMEVEKQKILGTQTQTSQSRQDDRPSTEQINSVENGSNMKKMLWVGIGVALILLIVFIFYFRSNNSENKDETKIESSQQQKTDNNTVDPTDASNDVYDYWIGRLRIDGYVYRLCDSRAYLEFEKSGDNYIGTFDLCLGYRDDNDRITIDKGELKGKVRAKDTGNGLLVTIVSYNIVNDGDSNVFSEEYGAKLKEGDQIFLITYSNESYTSKAIGKMERFFDGGEVTTNK